MLMRFGTQCVSSQASRGAIAETVRLEKALDEIELLQSKLEEAQTQVVYSQAQSSQASREAIAQTVKLQKALDEILLLQSKLEEAETQVELCSARQEEIQILEDKLPVSEHNHRVLGGLYDKLLVKVHHLQDEQRIQMATKLITWQFQQKRASRWQVQHKRASKPPRCINAGLEYCWLN